MKSNTNTEGADRSTPQSNPKDNENDIRMDNLKDMFYTDTIMDTMNRIMKLVESTERIKRGKNE